MDENQAGGVELRDAPLPGGDGAQWEGAMGARRRHDTASCHSTASMGQGPRPHAVARCGANQSRACMAGGQWASLGRMGQGVAIHVSLHHRLPRRWRRDATNGLARPLPVRIPRHAFAGPLLRSVGVARECQQASSPGGRAKGPHRPPYGVRGQRSMLRRAGAREEAQERRVPLPCTGRCRVAAAVLLAWDMRRCMPGGLGKTRRDTRQMVW